MAKTPVAVIGGTGLLGTYLTNGLLDNGQYDVTVITRKGGDDSKLAPFVAKGAKVAHVDFGEESSLVDALKGQEIVLSAVGTAALGDQPKYVAAAKAAGVRRFVPSEFGIDASAPGFREYFPAFGYKFAARDAVEASGLEWTYFITYFFKETTFTPFFFFDIPAGKATVKVDPHAPFTVTSLVDVGRWTAEALLDPSSKNASVYFSGATVTYDGVVKKVQEITGKPLDVTYVSKEGLEKEIADAPSPWAVFPELLLRAITDGQGILAPAPDKLFKSAHPEPSVTLEAALKQVAGV